MGYFAPIMAFGKTSEKTITAGSEPSATATTIAVDNTDDAYSVGDLLFCAESDSTENEYLGAIVSIAADKLSLVITRAVEVEKTTGATVWKPTTYVEFDCGPQYNEKHRVRPGTTTNVSRGGQVFATQTADPVRILDLSWNKGLNTDYVAFETFLMTNRDNARKSFTLAFYDHRTADTSVFEVLYDAKAETNDVLLPGIAGRIDPNDKMTFYHRYFTIDLDKYVIS